MKNRGGAQNGCSLLGGEEGALPMDPAEGYKLGMPASALSDTQPRSVPGSKGGRWLTSASGFLCCPMGSEIKGSRVVSLRDNPRSQDTTPCETVVVQSLLHPPTTAASMNPRQLHWLPSGPVRPLTGNNFTSRYLAHIFPCLLTSIGYLPLASLKPRRFFEADKSYFGVGRFNRNTKYVAEWGQLASNQEKGNFNERQENRNLIRSTVIGS